MNLTLFDQNSNVIVHETLATASPINQKKLSGNNSKVYNYMLENGSIDMVRSYKIGIINLFARIHDLRKLHDKTIYSRMVKVGETDCKEYSLVNFI